MLRISMLVAALGLAFASASAVACPGAAAQAAEPKNASVAQVDAWRKAKKATIIDANKRETFEAGHVPGAVHMRYDAVNAAVLPKDKSATIAAYCYSEQCGASKKLASTLMSLGYTQVYVMPEGIEGWKKAGKEIAVVAPAKAKLKTGG